MIVSDLTFAVISLASKRETRKPQVLTRESLNEF